MCGIYVNTYGNSLMEDMECMEMYGRCTIYIYISNIYIYILCLKRGDYYSL